MKFFDDIKLYVYLLTLLGAELYSAWSFLMGIKENQDSGFYLIFMVLISASSMIFMFIDYVRNNNLINIKIFAIPVFFFVCYLLDICKEGTPLVWTQKAFYFNMLYSVPAVLIASVLIYSDKVQDLYKKLDVIMFFLALGMIATLPKMLAAHNIIEGYNNISYQSALAFGYLYYGILARREDRYAFFKSPIYAAVSVILCILLCLTSLASGGRGGCVFLFILMSIVSLMYVEMRNIYKILFFVLPLGIVLFFMVSHLVGGSSFNSVLEIGMKRAFSWISDSGIDVAHSNREGSYSTALQQIQDSPILGHGMFHTIGTTGYPHNIFLEIWEGGGIFYLLIWLIIFYKSFTKIKMIVKYQREFNFLIPLFLYPCVMLMFSGTYLMTSLFWFIISFCLLFPINIYNKNDYI